MSRLDSEASKGLNSMGLRRLAWGLEAPRRLWGPKGKEAQSRNVCPDTAYSFLAPELKPPFAARISREIGDGERGPNQA